MPAVARALDGIATSIDGDHGWISEDWLRAQEGVAQDAAWQDAFGGVIAYATKKGWIDPAARAIRAHIEWRGDDDI
jgi:hypothetical protein